MSKPTDLQQRATLLLTYLRKQPNPPTQANDKIEMLGGITLNSLRNWQNGKTGQITKATRSNESLCRHLSVDAPRNLLSPQTPIRDLSRFLKIGDEERRRAIDALIREIGPTFAAFNMDPIDADRMIKRYRGLYKLYRWEKSERAKHHTGRPESILCGTLIVRYSLPGNKETTRHMSRVRAKLNLPSYRVALGRALEYDGYLTPTDAAGMHNWLFEERDAVQNILHLATGELEQGAEGRDIPPFMKGTMIGRTQDAAPRHAFWPIVIAYAGSLGSHENEAETSEDAETAFIDNETALLDPNGVDAWIKDAMFEAQNQVHFGTQS